MAGIVASLNSCHMGEMMVVVVRVSGLYRFRSNCTPSGFRLPVEIGQHPTTDEPNRPQYRSVYTLYSPVSAWVTTNINPPKLSSSKRVHTCVYVCVCVRACVYTLNRLIERKIVILTSRRSKESY